LKGPSPGSSPLAPCCSEKAIERTAQGRDAGDRVTAICDGYDTNGHKRQSNRGDGPAGAIPFECDEGGRALRAHSRWRLHLVKHRAILKNRVHSSLIAYGHQVPMADLFGVAGRRLLASLDFPEPWLGHVKASLELIDDLDRRIGEIERWLRRSGADHRYLPLLLTCPGIGWITGYTIAAEIGDINRFASPVKLTGYTGLCPRVSQSGEIDCSGPISKHGPRYLR